MPVITYADILFEKPKESSDHYTSVQQTHFSMQRIIDHQKRYWITQNPSPVPKPKILLLADWSAPNWSERKTMDVITRLTQVLEDGFRLYVWQNGHLESLTKETIFYLQNPAFRWNITPISQQQVIDTAVQQITRVGPKQLHVVDHYWMNYFLDGGGSAVSATYVVRYSDLPDPSTDALSVVLKLLENNIPKVSQFIYDKLPMPSDIEVVKISTSFPHISRMTRIDHVELFHNNSLEIRNLFNQKQSIVLNDVTYHPRDTSQIIELYTQSRAMNTYLNDYLWQSSGELESLTISYNGTLTLQNFTSAVEQNLVKLKVLRCIGSSEYRCSYKFFSDFLKHAKNLQSFIWTGVSIPELLERIEFPNLKFVDLPLNVSQHSIVQLLSQSHHIESLSSIPLSRDTIKQLDLSELKELIYSDRSDDKLSGFISDLALLLSKTPKLINLTIDVQLNWSPINKVIALPNLKKIIIKTYTPIHYVLQVLHYSRQLEYVDLTECHYDNGFEEDVLSSTLLLNPHIITLLLPKLENPHAMRLILIHCHELKYLRIPNCTGLQFTHQTGFPSLPVLEHLDVTDVNHDDFCYIVSEATPLNTLVLNRCRFLGDAQKLRDFPNLTKVTFQGDCKVSKEILSKLMRNVQYVHVSASTLLTHICSIPLSQLKKIKLDNTKQYSNAQLERLLANIPSDAVIDGRFSALCFSDSQQTLKTKLQAHGATISNDQPLHVRHPFPISVPAPVPVPLYQESSSMIVPNNTQRTPSDRGSSGSVNGPQSVGDRHSRINPTRSQGNSSLDANTSADHMSEFHVTRVFFPTHPRQATPQAEHMRIEVYQDIIVNPDRCDIDHAFEIKKVGNPLIDLPIHRIQYVETNNLFAMAQKNLPKEGQVQLYAKKRFTLDGYWQAMPSMCPQEVMTHARANGIEMQYSSRDNLYYIRTNSPKTCDVEWLVTVPTAQPPMLPQNIARLVTRYKHFGKGALSITTPDPTGRDYLSCMEAQEKGACRHRAFAFKAFMKEHYPNIPVRLISNGCHMFVEVQYEGQWVTCDLGGYPAKLTLDESNNPQLDHSAESVEQIRTPDRTATTEEETKVNHAEVSSPSTNTEISQSPQEAPEPISEPVNAAAPIPDERSYDHHAAVQSVYHRESQQLLESLTDELVDELSTSAYYEHRLETWRKTSRSKESIAEYCDQLCSQSKNRLVELLSTKDVNTLSLSLERHCRETGRPVYYIDSPDDLRCSSPFLAITGRTPDDHLIGKLKNGPGGPLHEFLNTHRDDAPVLIVNYASFEADDIVRLNSLLDKVRRADSTPVPKKATVVGLLNVNKPDCYQGSDFYSRFHAIADCPFSTQELGETLYSIVQTIEHTCEGESIDLFHATDWETQLIGRWVLNQGQFHFEKGALVQALERGVHGITIQHGPWNDLKFVRFWQSLAVHKTLSYAGQCVAIPVDFACYKLSDDAYAWPQLARTALRVEHIDGNPHTHTLNPSLLPQFFGRYVCDNETESLQQMPGAIKTAKARGTLTVQVTRALSDDNWAMLLAACEKEQVQLLIDCPSSITLPWEDAGAQPLIQAELNEACISELTTVVIASTDMDSTVAVFQQSSAPWIVFDVSEYEPSDLLTRIDPKFDKKSLSFKFKQKNGALFDLLARGEQVILKGTFSAELLDHLSQLIKERFSGQATPGRLIVIQDSKAAQAALPILTHTVTVAKKLELLQLPKEQTLLTHTQLHQESLNRLRTRLTQDNPWQGMEGLRPNIRMNAPDLTHSKKIARCFDRDRLNAVNDRLQHRPYVFLTGLTSVGKTTFVEKMFTGKQGKLYQGEHALKRWARSKSRRRKVLFIDEANFQEWSNLFTLFNTPPGILIDGDYYPLTDQHKIIFAGNPTNYGDERKLSKLFHTYGNALVFNPMPPEYIYERILKPVLPEELFDHAPAMSAPWLAVYTFLCERADQDVLISARELQMMAMLTMSYHARNPGVPIEHVACYYAHHVAKHLVPKLYQESFRNQFPEPEPLPLLDLLNTAAPQTDFLITASRQPLITQLTDLLALRMYKRSEQACNDAQRYGGLGGIIIEGESGIGKSELVTTLLTQCGYEETHYSASINLDGNRFYRLSVDMDMSQKIKLLHQAFHEGSVVLIDEINSSPMMERLLNSLLMGKTLKGQRPTRPGFMIIGTQNPITLAGRRAPSNALARRLMTVTLPHYPRDEMIAIIAPKVGYKHAITLITAYEEKRAYAQANHLNPIPTFRDVIKIADEEAGIVYAQATVDEETDHVSIDEWEDTDIESIDSDDSEDADHLLIDEWEDTDAADPIPIVEREDIDVAMVDSHDLNEVDHTPIVERDNIDAAWVDLNDLEETFDAELDEQEIDGHALRLSRHRRLNDEAIDFVSGDLSSSTPGNIAEITPDEFHNQEPDTNVLENELVEDRTRELLDEQIAPSHSSLPSDTRRNWSFYFLWIGAVIFAIVAIIALCWALNVLIAPTLGMGPFAIAVAAVLSIKIAPLFLCLSYAAASVVSGLIAVGFFKSVVTPIDKNDSPRLEPNRADHHSCETTLS